MEFPDEAVKFSCDCERALQCVPPGSSPARTILPFIPAHSASKTRVNALVLGIQCPALGPRNGVPATRASRGRPSRGRAEAIANRSIAAFPWTVGTRFATGRSPRGRPGRHSGRIAQLVEQLTLNQRVPGSSPGAPTNGIKRLAPFCTISPGPVYTSVYSFRSPFELLDRVLRERLIATEVVLVENVLDVLE